jgi:hypothetical protein
VVVRFLDIGGVTAPPPLPGVVTRAGAAELANFGAKAARIEVVAEVVGEVAKVRWFG